MRIGITLDENGGLDAEVSSHFGQCKYFLIVDIENGKVTNVQTVPNPSSHGGGACTAADAIAKYSVSHMITGGMGMNAQQKFENAGITVRGFTGKAKEALDSLLKNELGGLSACRHHGNHSCH